MAGTTLDTLGAQIEKGFAAVASDIADIRRDMVTKTDVKDFATKADFKKFPTKDEVRLIMREELRDVRSELKSIRTDLDDIGEKVDNITGYRKEIDHALERIGAIENYLDSQSTGWKR